MGLLDVSLRVGVGLVILLVLGLVFVVGLQRVRRGCRNVPSNLRAAAPALATLLVILLVNSAVRDAGVDLSWVVGVRITGLIHAFEGGFVAALQSLATPTLTLYFELVYVVGYAFLLVFPFVAYSLLGDERPLEELLVAYAVNYLVGLVCYVAFVAYGPRNFMPEMVGSLLYNNWPQAQLLTSAVNANTNVFPSLHASLSITVALLAYRSRSIYPRWVPVAIALATSVVLSTMYLGIHWATDVLAGLVLACVGVVVGTRVAEEPDRPESLGAPTVARLRLWLEHR